jgi:SAM-dependent MidA family methyltransferase
MNALAGLDALPSRYAILDVSPDLRERQRAKSRARADHIGCVEWLERCPRQSTAPW